MAKPCNATQQQQKGHFFGVSEPNILHHHKILHLWESANSFWLLVFRILSVGSSLWEKGGWIFFGKWHGFLGFLLRFLELPHHWVTRGSLWSHDLPNLRKFFTKLLAFPLQSWHTFRTLRLNTRHQNCSFRSFQTLIFWGFKQSNPAFLTPIHLRRFDYHPRNLQEILLWSFVGFQDWKNHHQLMVASCNDHLLWIFWQKSGPSLEFPVRASRLQSIFRQTFFQMEVSKWHNLMSTSIGYLVVLHLSCSGVFLHLWDFFHCFNEDGDQTHVLFKTKSWKNIHTFHGNSPHAPQEKCIPPGK